jgi:hypothetical protein
VAIRDAEQESVSGNGHPTGPDYSSLFSAPDYATLVKPAQTAKAKEYSDKVKSFLKAGMVGAINVGDFPDAATILERGPAFADATGQFADSNERVAKMVDIITSPSNPAMMFFMTGLPFMAQIVRNHEAVIKDMPELRRQAKRQRKAMAAARKAEKPRFTVRVLGREFPVRFRTPKFGAVFGMFRAQTRNPEDLTIQVFSDPAVQRALRRQGINLVRAQQPPE